jgi:AcrR family transcriptional regulator
VDAKISDKAERRRRSDGERSRAAILRQAARLATVEGLNGLTISRLADAVGMSKSGLFAHFGSKEELQLATVDLAEAIFVEQVIEPAEAAPTALERVRLLAELFLQHVERGVYPGGCFFASTAMELAIQSGPVRERVLAVDNDYVERIRIAARDAQAEGSIAASENTDQLAFELTAYLIAANMHFGITHEPAVMDRARGAIAWRLEAAAP